jgi:hypothetical protein
MYKSKTFNSFGNYGFGKVYIFEVGILIKKLK